MAQVKVLAFAGSTRTASYNKKLIKIAMRGAKAAGGEVTYLDLRDLDLPLYDGDLEESRGLPPGARHFKDLLIASDAILISSPEYNSSISGALKNAIDWASRPVPGEKPLEAFRGKVAGLLAASPGMLGGLRGLVTVRSILSNIHVIVLPEQLAVSQAHHAFDENGDLKDEKQRVAAERVGQVVVEVAGKLKA
jgi:chromate reductase, NAD(P)H dehydrogenase (quinone)